MKYCLKCGKIYAESYDEYERENCFGCGFQLIEDNDMTEEQFLKLSESEKDAYELKVYNICKQSEFFDENKYNKRREQMYSWYSTFRFDKYEQMTGEKAYTKENELYHDMKARERVDRAMAKYAGTTTNSNNKVACPFCKSTNVRKIGSGERVVSVLGLGLLSKKINKSFKCNSCGGTF